MDAPTTIITPESKAVARTPNLSSMIPANIKNNAKTLRKYSELAKVP
jgi:hypothetical protein